MRDAVLGHLATLYGGSPDPWGTWSSAYERRKIERALARLPRRRYRLALDIGCGSGALTARLAGRADRVLALEPVEAAREAAGAALAGVPNVELLPLAAPAAWPAARPDLVVLSEVLYYLEPAAIDRLARRITASARPGADILVVSWRGPTGTPLRGPAAAARLLLGVRCAVMLSGERRGRYDILVLGLRTGSRRAERRRRGAPAGVANGRLAATSDLQRHPPSARWS